MPLSLRRGRRNALRMAVLATLALGTAALPAAAQTTAPPGVLRVCSDPDNMPFSNENGDGFENRIARILAADLGLRLEYAWGVQYRGFLRKTLVAGACDVVMGVPAGTGRIKTTRPYYRSSYVFVWSRSRGREPASFDDPALRDARIGLQVIGMEGANTPPAMALARRDLAAGVVGFGVWSDEGESDPEHAMIAAVADGSIDLAVAWGPTAGWYARPFGGDIALTPIVFDRALAEMPFSYAISIGVRKPDGALLARLQGALDRRRAEIDAVLADFGVPLVDTRDHRDAG